MRHGNNWDTDTSGLSAGARKSAERRLSHDAVIDLHARQLLTYLKPQAARHVVGRRASQGRAASRASTPKRHRRGAAAQPPAAEGTATAAQPPAAEGTATAGAATNGAAARSSGAPGPTPSPKWRSSAEGALHGLHGSGACGSAPEAGREGTPRQGALVDVVAMIDLYSRGGAREQMPIAAGTRPREGPHQS